MIKLDSLTSHLHECEHNPKRPVPCTRCGIVLPMDELKRHNCVRELRELIHTQQQKITEFKQEIQEQKLQIAQQQRDLDMLKVLYISIFNLYFNTHHWIYQIFF